MIGFDSQSHVRRMLRQLLASDETAQVREIPAPSNLAFEYGLVVEHIPLYAADKASYSYNRWICFISCGGSMTRYAFAKEIRLHRDPLVIYACC